MKTYSQAPPPILLPLDNISCRFHYNITKISDNNYESNYIVIEKPISYEKLVEKIISEKYTIQQELAITGRYLESKDSDIEDKNAETNYFTYRNFVQEVKNLVKNALANDYLLQ